MYILGRDNSVLESENVQMTHRSKIKRLKQPTTSWSMYANRGRSRHREDISRIIQPAEPCVCARTTERSSLNQP
jgi:hypothetical protein